MKRLTDPIENLRCYIMVHGGLDRHERLLDVEYLEDVLKTAKAAIRDPEYMYVLKSLRDALSG